MAIYYGKTVEEAIENGLKEMDLDKSQVEVHVLEEPTKGFLGINAKKAKVEVLEVLSDGQRAVRFLDGLFDKMNVTAKCDLKEEAEKIVIDVTTDNTSAVIGYRGEILDSIQNLAGAVANTGREDYRRVVVDCEGYRVKREETLTSLAQKLAAKAVKTGRKVKLEPMSPYERRILHSALTDSTEVKTQSEGKEPNRYVVIIPNNLKSDAEIDERRYGGKHRDGGYRKDGKEGFNGRRGGRRERSEEVRQPRPKTSGFGTFLGNSKNTSGEEE